MGESTASINKRIAEACRAHTSFKQLEKELDGHKEYFKELAKKNRQVDFENSNGDKIKISPSTTNSITPRDFDKLLKKLKLRDHLYDCITVQIGKAKVLVGETQLATVMESTTKDYAKVNIKPSKS